VIDSRTANTSRAIRRRRECENCNHRFTTFEKPEFASFLVVKRDNTREIYDRTKLEEGIWLACTKRPVTQEMIDNMISSLEEEWSANVREISTVRIGRDILERLKEIDDIAYVRFLSVYKKFKNIKQFLCEIDLPFMDEKEKQEMFCSGYEKKKDNEDNRLKVMGDITIVNKKLKTSCPPRRKKKEKDQQKMF